jgi:hypothetical protein
MHSTYTLSASVGVLKYGDRALLQEENWAISALRRSKHTPAVVNSNYMFDV